MLSRALAPFHRVLLGHAAWGIVKYRYKSSTWNDWSRDGQGIWEVLFRKGAVYNELDIRSTMVVEPNERLSSQLTEARILELLRALPTTLASLLGSEIVEAMYGWGADLHIDLCWKPMEVGTAWLDRFIRESLDPAIVVPGEADFIFTVRAGALKIRFCHESDLHVSGTDQELISRFLSHPPFSEVEFRMLATPGVEVAGVAQEPRADV
jgi:hypothetical protein